MLINNIEFPYELIKAINNNKLVVFAGAGISKNEPTSLPDFKELTDSVAKTCGKKFDDNEKIEDYLGDLYREGYPVNDLVAERLKKGTQKPNDFHFNLLRLFSDQENIRIVTTNQDEMFEAAAKKMGYDKINIYSAPALPYGNDFTGIIHLHGRVSESQNIVVTDVDFGRAYMLNGYATRFVANMINSYVVLFIGYSYGDVVMRYLTSSIPKDMMKNAFILMENDKEVMLPVKRTNLKIITFEPKKFAEECDAIRKIGDFVNRNLLSWKDCIFKLSDEAPPADEEMQDEILEGIKDIDVQTYFCKQIKSIEWLNWLDEKGVFQNLFRPNAELSKCDKQWIIWILDNFMSAGLLELIARHNNLLNSNFSRKVLWICNKGLYLSDNDLFKIYNSLLRKELKENLLYMAIKSAEERKMFDEMWDMFSLMFNYDIKAYIHNWSENLELGYSWPTSDHLIFNVWKEYVKKHIDGAELRIFRLACDTLKRLYMDLDLEKGKMAQHDIDRFDIEHNNDFYCRDKAIYVICDMMDRGFAKISQNIADYANEWIIQTLGGEKLLLQKLSLLFLRKYSNLSPDEKITIIFNSNCDIHSFILREQLFLLVADIFDLISDENKRILINKIMDIEFSLPSESKKEIEAYEKYNWLIWIKNKSSYYEYVKLNLENIEKEYPYFKPRKHPEQGMPAMEIKLGIESPLTEEELLQMSPVEIYDYIKNYNAEDFWGPDKYGLLIMVSNITKKNWDWGIKLAKDLVKNQDYVSEIWEHILWELGYTINKIEYLSDMLDLISEDLIQAKPLLVSRTVYEVILKDKITKKLSNEQESDFVIILNILWKYRLPHNMNPADQDLDYNTTALNNITGLIAHSILYMVLNNKESKDLPEWFLDFYTENVKDKDDVYEFIFVLCAYAINLYYLNKKWVIENIFPYLKRGDENYNIAAWKGFLNYGHSYNAEIGNILLPVLKDNVEIIDKLLKSEKNAFINAYILLAVYLEEKPIEEYISILIKNCDEDGRKFFAYCMRDILEKQESLEREKLWNNWLKEYWQLRNKNVPRELCSGELSEMVYWIPLLENHFEECVDLLLEIDTSEGLTYADIFDKFCDTDLIEKYPAKTADFVYYLLKHTGVPVKRKCVDEIIAKLKQKNISEEILECITVEANKMTYGDL